MAATDATVSTAPHRAAAAPPPRRAWLASLGLLAGLMALLVFAVYPAILIVWGSFSPSGSISSGLDRLTVANYVRIFQSGFARFIANSILVCVLAVLIATVLSVFAAYAFSRLPLRGRRFLFGSVLMGQIFPWIILINPLFIIFAKMGMTNSYTAMVFCYTAIILPFSIYMLTGYMATVPRSLDEAALMDGCNRWQALRHVVLPVMWPGIVATATYGFLQCWAEYLLALAFLTNTDMKTIPLGLYQFFGDDRIDWGAVMAASAVATLPAILLFLPLQSRLAGGLTAGAVK
jgi:ABC-type glycerol-3-phosphate transport system permease component